MSRATGARGTRAQAGDRWRVRAGGRVAIVGVEREAVIEVGTLGMLGPSMTDLTWA